MSRAKCTGYLKVDPMRDYVREVLRHKRHNYDQCLGIRADEIDRMNDAAIKKRVMYPLVSWGITKQMVIDWWAAQEFDLDLPEYLGNCVACFKKSDRKLFTIARNHPEFFEFPLRMEREHSQAGSYFRKAGEISNWYRKSRTAAEMIATSNQPFKEWTESDKAKQIGLFSLDEMDYSNGCTESCEVGFI